MSATNHQRLHGYAHARAGDKGDRLSLCVFAYEPHHYNWLLDQVTEAKVAELFAHRGDLRVKRYPLPLLGGVNLVIDDALQGGVNGALNLDGHGKTLSSLLLNLPVQPPNAKVW
ncbi:MULTISPECIES: hypothetical protein [Halomonadaceae]|uniref:AtuA-related protein n=1 Tax=Halomonadaceae TaxID=28256 RepID=UPI001597CED4|nr:MULTISPECIES: hypothetical protein [Halomonas]QJQ95678.1 hypothetical protein HIO72_10615 [Halomonas sp. PA5]